MSSLRWSRPGTAPWQAWTLPWLGLVVGVMMLTVAGPLAGAWSAPGPAVPNRSIYVTNQLDNTLSVIDQSSFKATATIATGNSPYGIAVVQPAPTNGRATQQRGVTFGRRRHLPSRLRIAKPGLKPGTPRPFSCARPEGIRRLTKAPVPLRVG